MTGTVVAAAQFVPEYGDFEKGVAKAVAIVEEASRQQVELLVFPELWFLGYPYWASMDVRGSVFQGWLKHFLAAAGPADDPRLRPLFDAAGRAGMAVSLSIHERCHGSLYNTQLLVGSDGKLLGSHRKLMPTNTERLIHGQGRGEDLRVYDCGFGRVSGLLCFEHQMTLARAAVGSLNPAIHCAQWPGHAFLNPIIDASMRQFAHENGCFVICAREVMSADHLPAGSPGPGGDPERWQGNGGSSIVQPNATYVAQPLYGEESLVLAEIDWQQIAQVKYLIDNQGHYSRPDVFELSWKTRPC